jgi:hypothetical protein
MKPSIGDNPILWELRRFQMANGKEQMANGKPKCQNRMKPSIADNPILWELRRFEMANGKEPATAGQMENHLNFGICHLPFEIVL